MEVRIGVQHAAREVVVDTKEDADAIEKLASEALAADGGLLTLTDTRGRRVLVPADRIAYLEIGAPAGTVGFRS